MLFRHAVCDVECAVIVPKDLRMRWNVLGDFPAALVNKRAFTHFDVGADGAIILDHGAGAYPHAVAYDDVVSVQHRLRHQLHFVSDFDIAQHFNADRDKAIIADLGMAMRQLLRSFFLGVCLGSQSDLMHKLCVFADAGGLADNIAGAVIDKQVFADLGARMDINAGAGFGRLRQFARNNDIPRTAFFMKFIRLFMDGDRNDTGIYMKQLFNHFPRLALKGCVFFYRDIGKSRMRLEVLIGDFINLVLKLCLASYVSAHIPM